MTVVNPKSISGINSITTGSGSDNLLTIHTNDGTERLRIDSTGATKIVTGIVTTLTATTGIVTTLTANTVTSLGAVSGTTGTFSGAVSGTTGTFSGALSGTTGTFTGDVSIPDTIVHTGDTNTKIRFPDADTIAAETGGSERIRIKSNGYVGIGTNNPQRPFVISNSGAAGVEFNIPDGNGGLSLNLYNRVTTGYDPLTFNAGYFVFGPGATEKIRITSTGLNIGSTGGFDSNGDDLTITNSSHGGISIKTGTTSDGVIRFGDGSGNDEYRGYINYRHNGDKFLIGTSGLQRLSVDSDGLKFGSDTAAENALDDYEEGTFTPSFTQGVSGGSYSQQSGNYTKVGRLVMVSMRIDGNGLSANGSNFLLGGLPFTSVSSRTAGGLYFAYTDNFYSGSSGTNLALTIIVNNNATVCEFFDGDGTQKRGTDFYDVNRNIHIVGTYHAA